MTPQETQMPPTPMPESGVETWNPERPIRWEQMSDDELRTIGAEDTFSAVSRTIVRRMSFAARARDFAAVVADESVIAPESADGVIHLSELQPYYERVAFGLGSEPASASDRVACLFAIYMANSGAKASSALIERCQHQLTALLLEHPVLLSPRLVIPVRLPRASRVEHMSVFSAMLMTGIAQLPSTSHGVSEDRIRRLANSNFLMAPISRATPRCAMARFDGLDRLHPVETHGVALSVIAGRIGKLHPEMLASFLELGRLRDKQDAWPGHSAAMLESTLVCSSVLAAIPRSIGPYVIAVSKDGAEIVRRGECSQFLEELTQSRLLEDVCDVTGRRSRSSLVERLATQIQRTVLHTDGSASLGKRQALPAWMVKENTALQLALLKRIGLARDAVGAAGWFYVELIGGGPHGRRVLPNAETEEALAVLSTLAASGLSIPPVPPSNLDADGKLKGPVAVHVAWSTAHAVVARKQAMEAALDAASDAAAVKPTRATRRRGASL